MTKSMFRVLGVVASLVVGGAASAADAPAVEWKVSDGGNGHWYRAVSNSCITWKQSLDAARSNGGDLASITSETENVFVFNISKPIWNNTGGGPWLGGYQDRQAADYQEPDLGWRWSSGEPWTYTNWKCTNPSNSGGHEDVLNFAINDTCGTELFGAWNDATEGCNIGYIIEWSADCNGDGSVDYGQIQSGELADTNHNNIPDVCELVITSVQPISGASIGGTAVKINGNNFPISPTVTFGGVSATDIVRVTPSLITAVTPAGTPGMTMVAVNGASSESFYYRPNCGSDLDNNGVVDSADVGIVLLDIGNCSESLTTPQQEPMIFQTVETPTPVLNKK